LSEKTGMDELSKEYVISFFDKTLQRHGDRPEAVRWTYAGQRLRYECLLDIGDNIHGKKVLDYGCGKGDFYNFLKDNNISVQYSGFDINKNLISLAKQKFPESTFRVFDIEKDILNEDFDYIFLCGVFNLKLNRLDESIKNILIRLFKYCRIALAFNALSAYDPKKTFELHYVSPIDMLEFAIKNLSPFVTLIHDRIPYDFTMFVRREVKALK
jgi:SAM-dependent methyltransferase